MKTALRFLSGFALLALAGCASMADTPPSVDVTGNWTGTWIGNPATRSGTVNMTLRQNGSEATGDMRVTGAIVNRNGFVRGRVVGNTLMLTDPPDLRVTLTVNGDQMAGRGAGQIEGQVTLTRQK